MILKVCVEKIERLREGVAVEFSYTEKPNEHCSFIVYLPVEYARDYYVGQALELVEVRPT